VITPLTRLAGPALLLGSVAAVWVGVGLGPLASPQTQQAATSHDVTAATPARPLVGTVLDVTRVGDRVQLRLRYGSSQALVDVAPGVLTHGTTLAALAAGARPRVSLEYGPDGAIRTITTL
jgi:hypothetical protein